MELVQLLNALQSIRTRVRVLGALFGAGIALAGLIILALVTVLIDYLFNLSSVPRLLLIVVTLGAVGYAIFRWIIRPLMARLTLGDVAGRIEQAFPQFNDRLRSTVDFAENGAMPGSEAMKRKVIIEASQMALSTNLNAAIETKPVWYSLGAAGLAIAILLSIVLTINPQLLQIAMSRVLTPFNSKAWPKKVQIAVVGDVPRLVPVGARVPIKIRLERGDNASRKPILFYKNADGVEQSEFLIRGDDGTYSANLDAKYSGDAKSGLLNARIVAGDDERAIEPITIVPRLAIQSVEAAITPPAYAKLPASTVSFTNGPVVVTAGTNVELRINFNKPLDGEKQVQLEGMKTSAVAEPVKWDHSQRQVAIARWTAVESARFHVSATDSDGFTNLAIEEYEILVRPDQNPLVQIENPRRNEERTPVSVVPLQVLAEDDFGINVLELVVTRLGDKKEWTIDLAKDGSWQPLDSSADRKRFRINYSWDLSKLEAAELKSGDVLEYFARAQDNYDLNGKTHAFVNSGRLRITIISQEEFADRIAEELRNVVYNIGEIRNLQNRTERETGNLKKDTEQKDKLDAADRAVAERLAAQQATAATQSKQLVTKLQNLQQSMEENKSNADELKATAKDVEQMLDNTAENPMKAATNELNEARDPKQEAKERNESLENAQSEQRKAADQLAKAMDRMGNVGTMAQTIDQIRQLLEEQQKVSKETADIGKRNIGKKPEQMSQQDREKLEKNVEAQKELAKKTESALNDMAKQADQMSKSNPSDAEAMKKASETGQQQQVSQNQQKAASSAQQNQQASAQAAQRQAELGLEMILSQLREAERRKLEELTRKLAELQQQIANLIKRQSGHNLDNLALQGPEKVSGLDEKTLTSLLEATGRTKDNITPPQTIGHLSTAQEQTERNTRDIGQMAEQLPNSGEIGSQITRAAERMQRAIVFLRDSKLPDAYQPPMVEALAALQEAKKLVDQQKEEADKKQDDQKKESLRQVYVKIKTEQEKLNTDTKRVDTAPKAEDGSMRREYAVRLGQLPGEEQKLADEARKLEETLSSLGSVVYVWANKDLVRTMDDVKDLLGQSKTGALTQQRQKKIIDQLDALIRNLATKPKENDFAQRQQGGGGGSGSGAALPSEVELRLLKDLQLNVNDMTKQADASPEKDVQTIVEIGGRQGELRSLLGTLLENASRGQLKLGPEPDNKDQLPEEATEQQIEDQELAQTLLSDKPEAEKIEKDARLIGDRMARSRQRLALNQDAGKTTQTIQERIIIDLDLLIDQARKQQGGQMAQKPRQGGQQAQQPGEQDGGKKPQNQGQQGQQAQSQNPAQNEAPKPLSVSPADLSKDIQEKLAEWGQLTPRQRAAIMEGADEVVIEKYRKLIDDYYRTLATKATEK